MSLAQVAVSINPDFVQGDVILRRGVLRQGLAVAGDLRASAG